LLGRSVTRAALAATLLLGAGGLVPCARAGVLEITTSTPAPSRDGGQAAMDKAVRSAIEALPETVGFTPALVVLTRAAVVGGRLYLRLLLADEDGARALRDRSPLDGAVPFEPKGRDLEL